MIFSLPLCQQAPKKEWKTREASLINVGNIVGGVIVLIWVAVLLVALGFFFFGLLVLIKYLLTGRRTTGSMSGAADLAMTLARKRDIGRLIRSGISCVPKGSSNAGSSSWASKGRPMWALIAWMSRWLSFTSEAMFLHIQKMLRRALLMNESLRSRRGMPE